MAPALHGTAFRNVRPHFPIFQGNRVYPPADATHFRQKTTKSAKSCKKARAQKPKVNRSRVWMVQFYRKCPCRSDIRKRNHCNSGRPMNADVLTTRVVDA